MLTGKCALIVGATSELGEAVARAFAAHGAAMLVLSGRNSARLREICGSISGCDVAAVAADLTAEPPAAVAARLVAALRGAAADAFVYCPGTCGAMDPVTYLRIADDFARVADVNFRCCVGLFEAVAPQMAAGGAAVLIGSTNTFEPMECGSAYCATKAALREYARARAAGGGVRVNVVSPGMVDTKFHDEYFDTAQEKAEFFARIAEDAPMQRLATARGVADAVLFLASDLSADVNGAEVVVDCGASLAHALRTEEEEEESDV